MSPSYGRGISAPRVEVGRWRRFIARFDWPLGMTVLAIAALGLLNLYSATYRTAHSGKFDAQLIWMSVGLGLFFVMTYVDYRFWHRVAWFGLAAAIVAILAVKFAPSEGDGAKRWLTIYRFHVQPSEMAKIAVILALARVLHDRAGEERRLADVAPAAIGLAIPIVLIALQPDLGTAVLVGLIIGSVTLLLARTLWPLAAAGAAVLLMVPFLWDRMWGYQKSRILAFLDPTADPTGAGWHTQQSILAVGSGKLSGKGVLNATQNHFNFLPEYWTDFPFSVWAEEWGFLGSVGLLGVYVWLILWIVHIALSARDLFGTAICLGVAAMIFWHTIINVAMVLGVAPVVGLTLPLISYGGSSVLTTLLGLGLVSSVSSRRASFAS